MPTSRNPSRRASRFSSTNRASRSRAIDKPAFPASRRPLLKGREPGRERILKTLQRHPPALPRHIVERAVRLAFEEDLGQAGDITSQATIGPEARAVARVNARQDGVICGLDCALMAFEAIGPGLEVETFVADGDAVAAGDAVLEVRGNARALLAAERTALNFLTHLSGIATLTRRF